MFQQMQVHINWYQKHARQTKSSGGGGGGGGGEAEYVKIRNLSAKQIGNTVAGLLNTFTVWAIYHF